MDSNYAFGNPVDCIIRSYHIGTLGHTKMEYDNEPYTEISQVSCSINFDSITSNYSSDETYIRNSLSTAKTVSIEGCLATPKLLDLVFPILTPATDYLIPKNYPFVVKTKGETIFLPIPQGKSVYQLFVFNARNELKLAAGESSGVINTLEPGDYVAYYSCEAASAMSIEQSGSNVVKLDLISKGKPNCFIHISKCSLSCSRDLRFSGTLGTIDLTAHILKDDSGDSNYIAFE